MVIKRIRPLSVARLAAAGYAIAGLILGAVIALVATSGQLPPEINAGVLPGAALGAAAVIALPIFYGCAGFIVFLIVAVLYNALATIMGGIEFEVEEPAGRVAD